MGDVDTILNDVILDDADELFSIVKFGSVKQLLEFVDTVEEEFGRDAVEDLLHQTEFPSQLGLSPDSGRTPLMYAASMGNLEFVRALAEIYPRGVRTRDNNGETALFHAATSGHTNCLEFLIDFTYKQPGMYGHEVQDLLIRRVPLGGGSYYEESAMHIPARRGDIDTLALIFRKIPYDYHIQLADPTSTTSSTVLMYAAQNVWRPDVVELILSHADKIGLAETVLSQRNSRGMSVLELAASACNTIYPPSSAADIASAIECMGLLLDHPKSPSWMLRWSHTNVGISQDPLSAFSAAAKAGPNSFEPLLYLLKRDQAAPIASSDADELESAMLATMTMVSEARADRHQIGAGAGWAGWLEDDDVVDPVLDVCIELILSRVGVAGYNVGDKRVARIMTKMMIASAE